MKKFLALSLLAIGAAYAADTTAPMSLGVDFSMPYILQADGNEVNERDNFNMGVDGRYMITENINVGGRASFDIEEKNGSVRKIAFAPGMQYRWMTNENLNPYVRIDLPVTFKGAPSTTAGDTMDVGVAGGLGLAYNLSGIGIENMMFRYDFNMQYNLGISDAVDTVGIEFFKVGFDYRF